MDALEQQKADCIGKLSLHQSRRNQSIPTLSVLVGGAVTTQSVWMDWIRQADRRTAVGTYCSMLSLFEVWLAVVVERYDVRALILEHVAQHSGQSSEQLSHWLSHTSDYQAARFWQQYVHASRMMWFKALLSWSDDGSGRLPSDLGGTLRQAGVVSSRDDLSVIAQGFTYICELLARRSIPGILIRFPEKNPSTFAHGSNRYKVLAMLVQLVEAAPTVPVGILLSEQIHEWMCQMPESRVKAALRSGLIEITAPQEGELQQWLNTYGIRPSAELQSFIQVAQRYGVTEEILEVVSAIQASSSDVDLLTAEDSTFRSLPEQLLFQYLEAIPTTAGRFQVNAKLDIRFGNRNMEVDFLAADSRIVIELDGYHHFQAPDSYRRDRRKDITLQQHGFWVLRFLSDDIISHLEEILDTIEQVLQLRSA